MKNKKELREKIMKGITVAVERLIESIVKNDGYIVLSENGKVVRIKARNLK